MNWHALHSLPLARIIPLPNSYSKLAHTTWAKKSYFHPKWGFLCVPWKHPKNKCPLCMVTHITCTWTKGCVLWKTHWMSELDTQRGPFSLLTKAVDWATQQCNLKYTIQLSTPLALWNEQESEKQTTGTERGGDGVIGLCYFINWFT